MEYKQTINRPDYGNHIIFLGSTGSGKTVLAKEMLNGYKKFFVFDMQENFTLPNADYIKTPKKVIKAIENRKEKIVYNPIIDAQTNEINNYIIKKILESSYPRKKHERIIYIDEIFQLGYCQSFPRNLAIGFATARQKGISFFVATQRPLCIPSNVLTEASKIYIFQLAKLDDIKYISTFAPMGREKELLQAIKNLKRGEYKFIELDIKNQEMYMHNRIKMSKERI